MEVRPWTSAWRSTRSWTSDTGMPRSATDRGWRCRSRLRLPDSRRCSSPRCTLSWRSLCSSAAAPACEGTMTTLGKSALQGRTVRPVSRSGARGRCRRPRRQPGLAASDRLALGIPTPGVGRPCRPPGRGARPIGATRARHGAEPSSAFGSGSGISPGRRRRPGPWSCRRRSTASCRGAPRRPARSGAPGPSPRAR